MASISRLLSYRAPASAFSVPAPPSPRGRLSSTTPPPPPVFLHSANRRPLPLFGSPGHLRAPPPACSIRKQFGGLQMERIKGIREKLQEERSYKEIRLLWSFWDKVYPRAAKGEGRPGEAIPAEFAVPPRRGEGELSEALELTIARILESPFSEWSLEDMTYMEFATQGLNLQRATGLPFTAGCKVIPSAPESD